MKDNDVERSPTASQSQWLRMNYVRPPYEQTGLYRMGQEIKGLAERRSGLSRVVLMALGRRLAPSKT